MITNATETANPALAASATDQEAQVDPALFAQELSTRVADSATDLAARMAETLERLAAAFPGSTITNRSMAGFEQSFEFFTEAENSTVAVSPEMMQQMSESEELFAKAMELISSLMEAGKNQNLVNAGGDSVYRHVSVQATEIRYVEVQRAANGTQLSAASLAMENAEFMAQTLDQIFAWRNGGSGSGSGGGTGRFDFNQLSEMFNGSNAWRLQGLLSMSTSMDLLGGANGGGASMWGMLAGQRSGSFTASITIAIEQWSTVNGGEGGSGTDFMAYMEMMGLYDPLVLDLGDEGINLTSPEDGVYFDIKGDGSPVQTAWIQGNNAFLYLDENGNDVADDANELFGEHGGHANGWEKLREYDDNGDGVIDENDAIYSQLRLWRDLNGDGVNQKNESMTLAEAGVKSINLNHNGGRQRDRHGNLIADQSYFTRHDGSTGMMADVWLKTMKNA